MVNQAPGKCPCGRCGKRFPLYCHKPCEHGLDLCEECVGDGEVELYESLQQVPSALVAGGIRHHQLGDMDQLERLRLARTASAANAKIRTHLATCRGKVSAQGVPSAVLGQRRAAGSKGSR